MCYYPDKEYSYIGKWGQIKEEKGESYTGTLVREYIVIIVDDKMSVCFFH